MQQEQRYMAGSASAGDGVVLDELRSAWVIERLEEIGLTYQIKIDLASGTVGG